MSVETIVFTFLLLSLAAALVFYAALALASRDGESSQDNEGSVAEHTTPSQVRSDDKDDYR